MRQCLACMVMAYIVVAYTVMAYIVMACIVMAYIVMVGIVMVCMVMAYTVMVCIVMAYIVMVGIVMACIVMAYIVMAEIGGGRPCDSARIRGRHSCQHATYTQRAIGMMQNAWHACMQCMHSSMHARASVHTYTRMQR